MTSLTLTIRGQPHPPFIPSAAWWHRQLVIKSEEKSAKNAFSWIALLLCWPRYECDI